MLAVKVAAPMSPSVCASCRDLYGRTCCETKVDDSAKFPMTYREASLLATNTRQPLEEAVEVRVVSDPDIEQLREVSPSLADLVVDGIGLFLPIVNGKCVYLGDTGCMVPGVKPHVCGLFPFWKSSPAVWDVTSLVGGHGFCLGKDQAGDDCATALKVFKTNLSDLDATEARRRRDANTHRAQLRNWLRSQR